MINTRYEELFICQKYANEVIGYCDEYNIELLTADDAKEGILEFDRKCIGFKEWFGYDLYDYLGDIIAEIGMILEHE